MKIVHHQMSGSTQEVMEWAFGVIDKENSHHFAVTFEERSLDVVNVSVIMIDVKDNQDCENPRCPKCSTCNNCSCFCECRRDKR